MSDANLPHIRDEAARWCARMMRSDAELHRAEFDAWLQEDNAHRSAYDRIMRRYDRAGVLAWSALRRPSGRSRTRRWLITAGLAIAGVCGGLASAAVMLLTLSSALTRLFGPDEQHAGTRVARNVENAPYRVSTRVGEIRPVTLSDGSTVVLDTAARLVVTFRETERRLTLSHGRARFEVAHEKRPFVVEAGNGEITARGTIFDVEARDSGQIQVTLLRGAIDVRVRDGAHSAQTVRRLQVNQKAVFNPAGFTSPTQPAPVAVTDWPSGVVDVDSMPLADLLGQANRYATVPLSLDGAGLASLKVSGRFRIDQPDLLARNLADLFGLAIDRSHADRIVLARKI